MNEEISIEWPDDEGYTPVESRPNYGVNCRACTQAPTVDVFHQTGELIMKTELCGPCFFGEAGCVNPESW